LLLRRLVLLVLLILLVLLVLLLPRLLISRPRKGGISIIFSMSRLAVDTNFVFGYKEAISMIKYDR
jgi:hypothetical protein